MESRAGGGAAASMRLGVGEIPPCTIGLPEGLAGVIWKIYTNICSHCCIQTRIYKIATVLSDVMYLTIDFFLYLSESHCYCLWVEEN